MASVALPDSFVRDELVTYSQLAMQMGGWGIHLCFACYACSILNERGKKDTLAWRSQFSLVIGMILVSTVVSALILSLDVVTLKAQSETPPANALRVVVNLNTTAIWLRFFNFLMSDIIVVWRAWALWPRNHIVQSTLGVSFLLTTLCVFGSIIYETLVALETITSQITPQDFALMEMIPFIVINLVATLLIFYKTWIHRQEIRLALGSRSMSGQSGNTVGKVLALLVETGLLYVVCLIIYPISIAVKTDEERSQAEYEFVYTWTVALSEIAGIYPTVVIILVAKLMSTDEFIVEGTFINEEDHEGERQKRRKRPSLDHGHGQTLSSVRFAHQPPMSGTLDYESQWDSDNPTRIRASPGLDV